MAIEVDIHIGFPIHLPANGSTTAEEHISAEWFRWLLAPIPYYSSILFGFDHFSSSDSFLQKRFQRAKKTTKDSYS